MEPELAVVLTLAHLSYVSHSDMEGGEGSIWKDASYSCMLVTVSYQRESDFCMVAKLPLFSALRRACLSP